MPATLLFQMRTIVLGIFFLTIALITSPTLASPIMYVSSLYDGTIFAVDAAGSKSIFALEDNGDSQIWGLDTDEEGNLFAAKTSGIGYDSILKFDRAGNRSVLHAFDEGRDNPEGIGVRGDGTILVSGTIDDVDGNDTINDVLAINATGTAIKVGTAGTQENISLTIANNGFVYVTELNTVVGGRIWKIDDSGRSIAVATGIGGSPFDIAQGPDGHLYVAFPNSNHIRRFLLDSIGDIVSQEVFAILDTPLSLAFDDRGRLFVGQRDIVSLVDSFGASSIFASGFNSARGIAIVKVTESIPEPSILALITLGLAGIGYRRRRSKVAA